MTTSDESAADASAATETAEGSDVAGEPKGAAIEPTGSAPARAAAPAAPVVLPAKVAYPLAFLSGLLYFLGFPGMDFWPLAFVAMAPLLVALRGQTPRRAAMLGWTAGFTMTMTGFYWLLEMLKVFSGFPTAVCVLFMAILCAFQGGRIALAGWLYGRAEGRGWPAPVVFLLAFAASELVYPLLFPWYLGASVHNAPVFMQVSEIGGPILVGLVLVASSLAVAELVHARLDRRPVQRILVGLGLAAPVVAAAYGAVRMRAVDALASASESVKIGVVQPNLPLFNRSKARAIHLRRTAELRDQGVDLVVWSEAAVPQSFLETKYETDVPRALTGALGVTTVVGTVLQRPRSATEPRGRHFNTALLATADGGRIVGRYDKQYLLAFGEYLPLGETFPFLYKWSPNSGRFSPGTSIEPLVHGEHRIAALICYEDILPSFVNGMIRHSDPDLIVNLTNDAWFGNSTEPWIHLALAKLRAVEHRRYLVRATNSGVSAIVDANGRVVVHSTPFEEESMIGEARWMRQKTPYQVLGDVPWYLATAAALAMAFLPRRRFAKT